MVKKNTNSKRVETKQIKSKQTQKHEKIQKKFELTHIKFPKRDS